MKPNRFKYFVPDSIPEALHLLNIYQSTAKIISGGQSLMPMMNYRVIQPEYLIDIGRLLELDRIVKGPEIIEFGGITRYVTIEHSDIVKESLPIFPEVIRHIAHLTIRNRGTIGGSLAHADPASEMPMLMRLFDATFEVRSADETLMIPAHNFFMGPLITALKDNQLLTKVVISLPDKNTGWAFKEYARRSGDYALAAVGVTLIAVEKAGKNIIEQSKVAMMGVGDTPLRMNNVESLLNGQEFTSDLVSSAQAIIFQDLEPRSDLQSSTEFKKHLASHIFKEVIHQAWERALSFNTGKVLS
jgi:CO/xanthine dehydrogenase FAD-binding subunit